MLALLGIVAAVPPAGAQGTLDVTPKQSVTPGAPDGPRARLYGSSKALVIGIDDYAITGSGRGKPWGKLSMAVRDAEEVAAALGEQGFAVTLKKNLVAAELDATFRKFFIDEGADPEARLLVWFAGHGHTINGEGYLVPADAPLPEANSDGAFRHKALSLRRFGEYMREARAKHVLAVFDSCFSGSVFDVARAAPPPAITHATWLAVRQFVSSGEAEQVVSDDGTFRRLFVDALKGLEPAADGNGDGYITGTELGQFLFDKVTNLTERRQTPRYGKLNALGFDRGDFVLETRRPAVAVVTPQPAGYDSGFISSDQAEAAICREVETMSSLSILGVLARRHAGTLAGECVTARVKELESVHATAGRQPRVAALQYKAPSPAALKLRQSCRGIVTDVAGKGAVCLDPSSEANREFQDCKDRTCGPVMVALPKGSYMRGSETGSHDAKPVHEVTIGHHVAVGRLEVTTQEYLACVTAKRCRPPEWAETYNVLGQHYADLSGADQPIVGVSWGDAVAFAQWLSDTTGQEYRLLTEAEWEYAARGITDARAAHTRYSWGDEIGNGNANCSGCGGPWNGTRTAPAGSFGANAFGLHDMHGNVWEWVQDCYRDNYRLTPADGSRNADVEACSRVLRGGSWLNGPGSLGAAFRFVDQPEVRASGNGFRLARTLDPAGEPAAAAAPLSISVEVPYDPLLENVVKLTVRDRLPGAALAVDGRDRTRTHALQVVLSYGTDSSSKACSREAVANLTYTLKKPDSRAAVQGSAVGHACLKDIADSDQARRMAYERAAIAMANALGADPYLKGSKR